MPALLSVPGARAILATSILARLPIAALAVVLIVHGRDVAGSYAAGGLLAGAQALGYATGGPLLGRLADSQGQTRILLVGATVCSLALAAIALAPHDTPLAALVPLALLTGFSHPPINACARAIWPQLVSTRADLQAAYAMEAAVLELTYVGGPIGFLALAAWSTPAALGTAAVVLLVGTVAFASRPASRAWRGAPREAGVERTSALRAPGILTLALILAFVGTLFGAVEVAVPASAEAAGSRGSAGLLLGVWGLGSFVAGLAVARMGGVPGGGRSTIIVLLAVTVGHLSLALDPGPLGLAALLVLGGSAIAPMFATLYAMVDDLAPAGSVTESFAWLSTAITVGVSVGTTAGGALADSAGPSWAFAVGGIAAALATVVAIVRRTTLDGPPCPEVAVAVAG